MNYDESFPSHFRLKSRKQISRLFDSGQSAFAFPVLIKYLFVDELATESGLNVGFSVSKKHFKRAVIRNRIRRRMFESFRKLRPMHLAPSPGKTLLVMCICIADNEPEYEMCYEAIDKCLKKLAKQIYS